MIRFPPSCFCFLYFNIILHFWRIWTDKRSGKMTVLYQAPADPPGAFAKAAKTFQQNAGQPLSGHPVPCHTEGKSPRRQKIRRCSPAENFSVLHKGYPVYSGGFTGLTAFFGVTVSPSISQRNCCCVSACTSSALRGHWN